MLSKHLSRPSRDAWIETISGRGCGRFMLSRPSRDAWIETTFLVLIVLVLASRPSRDAWIETIGGRRWGAHRPRRVLHGTRGLKLACERKVVLLFGRVLHGTRGLKLSPHALRLSNLAVASFTGRVD